MKPQNVDLDAIVATVEAKVLARIAAALTSSSLPGVYTTRKGHAPPGWSDERWKATAPSIPGATKPGRWWVISREAFDRWQAAEATTPPLPPAANDGTEETWSPRGALESVGLRATRRK